MGFTCDFLLSSQCISVKLDLLPEQTFSNIRPQLNKHTVITTLKNMEVIVVHYNNNLRQCFYQCGKDLVTI